MPPELVALSEGPSLVLDKPIVLIGRHQECDILIPSRKISRRHCCIARVNDHLVVRDLCSTNGVRLNGTRVNEAVLNAGDELTIGNLRYQVRLESDAPLPKGRTAPRPQPPEPPKAPQGGTSMSQDDPVLLKDSMEDELPVAPAPKAAGVQPPPVLPAPDKRDQPLLHDEFELASNSDFSDFRRSKR
jgi:predicted component of type VI protein secretion system